MEEVITVKQARNIITEALSNRLVDDGFKYLKSQGFFVRKTKNKIESLYIRILNYWPYCSTIDTVIWDIEFTEVTKLIVPILGKYGFYNAESITYFSTIHDFIKYGKEVFNVKDVENFISENLDTIINKAYVYFNNYGTISQTNSFMKNMISNNEYGSTPEGTMRSMALMKLCNDPDYNNLTEKYKAKYISWEGSEERGLLAIEELNQVLLGL